MPISAPNFFDKDWFQKLVNPTKQSQIGDAVGYDSNEKLAGMGIPFVPTPAEYAQQNTPVTAPNPVTQKYDQSYFKWDQSGPDASPGSPAATPAPVVPKEGEPTKPANPYGTSYDVGGLEQYLRTRRNQDLGEGLDFGSRFFGRDNPEMAEILDTRRKRAMGLNDEEVQRYRERGTQGINQSMATGLRQLKGVQATNGVRGGAAAGQAIPIVNRSLQERGKLENEIALADMERRSKELGDYEHSVSGERAGLLGTGFGMAGLGAADRSSALQYGLGSDFLKYYGAAANKDINLGENKPWSTKDSLKDWQDHWFDPGYSPWQTYTKKNWGFDGTPFKWSEYFQG